jgi:hypothetical protein
MRQAIIAALAYFALQIYIPKVWEALMSSAPKPVVNAVSFMAALACFGFIIFSDPVYNRLKAPAANPVSSTLIIIAIAGAIGGTAWWQFVIKTRSAHFTLAEGPIVTPDNVDSIVKRWIGSFEGIKNEIPNMPDNHFTYAILYPDQSSILIFREKGHYDRFIRLESRISLTGTALEKFTAWPYKKQKELVNDLALETARAKINCNILESAEDLVQIRRDIQITSTLTDITFFEALHDIHSDALLITATLNKRFPEIDAEVLPPSSPSK